MKCNKCGAEISDSAKYCSECGSYIEKEEQVYSNPIIINSENKSQENNNAQSDNNNQLNDNQKANILCIISVALMLASSIFSNSDIVNRFDGLMSLVAFTLMIIVRVKYPKNTFGKVLMWIYIIYFLLRVILVIFFFGMMAAICGSCAAGFYSCPG